MSDAAVCEALDPHGAAWDAPRVVVHATTWMPILAAMVGTSLTGPACRGAAGRSFAAGSRRRWHRPDQCRASVGGSPSSPIATMMQPRVGALVIASAAHLLHHLARFSGRLIAMKLDEQMCRAVNVRVRSGHAY